jgi:type IV secretory pathway VirJ component
MLAILGIGLALVLGGTRALPHLFPQYLRPLWGTMGGPLAKDVPPALADLPVVEVDGHDPKGPVAVVLSGNGGWWGLCGQLAKTLAKAHVTTIGLNSLAYFVSRRTPEGTARDIERMVSVYAPDRPLLLIGYSYGADILATVYQNLSEAMRSRVKVVSLLGLTHSVRYGMGFWQVAAARRSTAPAVTKISGPAVQCFQGDEEGEASGCHKLDASRVAVITLRGGHHFGGDYRTPARYVIEAWKQAEKAEPSRR